MEFINIGAELFIPDGVPENLALPRTTSMAISAHEDDIEMMAVHGILECFHKDTEWFSGVVLTDGAGSLLGGEYTDRNSIVETRKREQKKAAYVCEYGSQFMLNYSSEEIKDKTKVVATEEIKRILLLTRPRIIYTHNLFDKHDTHLATAIRVISALRQIKEEYRPQNIWGCEMWGSLEWIDDKKIFDISRHYNIARAAIGVFDSQMAGGKEYQEAIGARHKANATFGVKEKKDSCNFASYAMDMTELVYEDDLAKAAAKIIDKYKEDTVNRINRII